MNINLIYYSHLYRSYYIFEAQFTALINTMGDTSATAGVGSNDPCVGYSGAYKLTMSMPRYPTNTGLTAYLAPGCLALGSRLGVAPPQPEKALV